MARRETKRARAAIEALETLADERDALRRLDAARRARESTDELERALVQAARADGRTWAEIGKLYGLTKQGAQQRFGATSTKS